MAATPWLSTYANRVKIPVNATSSGAQTDYQMTVVLHTKAGTNTAGDVYLNSHLQDTTAFNDIRFTTADGTTLKNFWVEKVEEETGGRKATVWVKLDTPVSGATDYYLYYGKAGDASASSYDNTFTKDFGESGLAGLWHMDEQTPGPELLTDGGLEVWTNTTTLTNWTSNGTSAGVRDVAQESVNKQAGSYALKLAATAAGGTVFGVGQNITTVSNQTYQVNLYQYYATRTAGSLIVEAYDNTNLVSLGSQSIITAGTAFGFTSIRFTSTNTTNVRIKIYLNSETTGVAYLDSVSVRQSTTALADASGNGNTGTISGASRALTDGGQWGSRSDKAFATGSALQFDGVNNAAGSDFVDAGNGASLDITNAVTIEAWVNRETLNFTQNNTILSKGSTSYAVGGATNTQNLLMYITIGGTLRYVQTTTNLAQDTWYHVVWQFPNVNSKIAIYVNGVLDKESAAYSGAIGVDANHVFIGKLGNSYFFNGKLDDVRIYNRALSAGEISRHYLRSKYAAIAPLWSVPASEEGFALGTTSQAVDASTITTTGATLSGYLTGFGGDTSASVSFKYGVSSDTLDQTTAPQAMSDYGPFSKVVSGLAADTTYYFQAAITDSAGTAYGSVLSFRTAAPDTDYYRTIINGDGSLTFINKDTGAVILSGSPHYSLNYGASSAASKSLTNSSFETDVNTDSIPDGWTADKAYLRLSTEYASQGTKSFKFNMASTDSDHRRSYSSLVPVTQDKNYAINVDSYASSFTSGMMGAGIGAAMYVAYYDTVDGSGTQHLSSQYSIPIATGVARTSSFDWTPPSSAKSFKLLFYSDKNTIAIVYFDNVSIAEKTYDATVTSGTINHTVSSNGDSSVITAVDNSNPYAEITHRYELNAHSPYIKYTATLRYKQNVDVREERFDFIVPTQSAQVMTRDMAFAGFDTAQPYWSDVYTPKAVKFTNGLSFLGSDTMDSMRLRASGSDSQLSFYSDLKDSHPSFYYVKNGGGAITDTSPTKRLANDTYSASVIFAINPVSAPKSLVKARQPYGYDATLNFTNHADDETIARVKAVAYGTEDESNPNYGTQGIAGRGLGWTKSVFVSGQTDPYADLANAEFKALTDQMYADGVEIVGHSITPILDSRATVANGLQTLSQYNAQDWIDHGASGGVDNWEDLTSQGSIKGDANYSLDMFDQYNYKYAWSYVDLTTASHGLNMLQPAVVSDLRPFLFYSNQVDDNVNDTKKIYLWSTLNTIKIPDQYYADANVDSLISERGVHIGHEYMSYSSCNDNAFYTNSANGKVEIYPAFDAELAYIAQKREDGLIWSPTVLAMGDYLVPLKDVLVTPNADGTYTVTNSGIDSVTGVTLLTENDIRSVTIDGKSLTSFGGSFGAKELVLPTLASGQSVNLIISYGAKDASLPTITSNDTGKSKVNEITGVYDSGNKTLTMTAEGNGTARSFTVRVPALAGKNVLVQDNALGITIGNYQASDVGEVSFSVSLGSVRTFVIGETPNASFVFPSKPSVSHTNVTGTPLGKLTLSNLPDTITQLAVSTTQDFKNVSWESIQNLDAILQRYVNAVKLYFKFRTGDGGVSDVITYEGKKSDASGNGSSDNANITGGAGSMILSDGDIVKTINNPDVYIIKYKNGRQYKRLVLSPTVFKSYGHLKWSNLKIISQAQMDSFLTSSLVKETKDTVIYTLFPSGDKGERRKLDSTSPYDLDSVYEINKTDRDSYKLVK